MSPARAGGAIAALATLAGLAPAHADPRPWHGSIGAGGSLLLTGQGDGSRLRVEGEVDVLPGGALDRYGGLLALRAADADHHGLACLGLLFEAAAARPRLALALHADLGVDLDAHAPVLGGGARTTLTLVGPLGVALDTGAYLVLDGLDHTRLAIDASTMLVVRW